ncbi:MAG: response regulator receiver protein [Bryobacterales bacterium]|nr:response regulator receiver protein [Bryobacterales bacterium]
MLLIEDNAGDVRLIVEALKRHEVVCEISAVADGEAAVKHIDQIEGGVEPLPDLVIIDLNLPKKSGLEVLKKIRMSGVCTGVTIIVLTSSDNQRDRESVAVYNPANYIRKPITLSEFMSLGAEFKRFLTPLSP